MKNQAKLKEMGFEGKERYYYIRTGEPSRGIAAVCIIPTPMDTGIVFARGVSFCNPKDQFSKKTGRAIALGRAVKAIEHNIDSDFIQKTTPAIYLSIELGWVAFSVWNATLTRLEAKLFKMEV
jgi:hypothetical protein